MGIQGDKTSDPRLSPLRTRSFWRKAGSAFLRLWGLWLVGLALLVVPPFYRAVKPQQPAEKDPPPPAEVSRADLRELQDALGRGDDPAILEFFRRRRLSAEERRRVQELIGKLADDSFRVRLQASEELTKFGPRAAGMLRQGTRHPDAETAEQARQLLSRIVTGTQAILFAKAFRRLQEAFLPDTVSVLLDYLPDAEDDHLADQARAVLASLGIVDGQPDPALIAALSDPLPEKRWSAASVLAPQHKQYDEIWKLLDDPVAEVRYRTVLTLLKEGHQDVFQLLIELLPEMPEPAAWNALDILFHAAGKEGPPVGLGVGAAGRQNCRDAWRAWQPGRWKPPTRPLSEGKQAFAKMRERGPALLVQLDLRSNRGIVEEIDADGKLNRTVDDLDYPVWAESLPDNRLLIVEYRAWRVSERDRSGSVAWSVSVPQPVFAQRLPDGSTFIACRDALWTADGKGIKTLIRSWPERIVATARPCLNGDIVLLTVDGTCIFLDSEGKEKRRFETGCKLVHAPGIDVTANNRVLVPDHAGQRVVEFSPQGEVLWQASVPSGLGTASPVCVQRLPDGNTLVTSTAAREVIEISRLGRVVWRLPDVRSGTAARPIAAVRR